MSQPRRRLCVGDAQVLRDGFASIRHEHGVAIAFPQAADAEASAVASTLERAGRTDLTDLPFVTIDPPGSRDLDQAMHLERAGSGFRVRYAIADVSAFIVPGGALDRAVHDRVMTVYCPDTRVPLHPTALSEGAASLAPGQDRPAVVWDLSLDADGEVTSVHVGRACVRSRAQLDYPSQQQRLDAGTADDVIQILAEIGVVRARLERERGGVSLARPEQEVVDAPGGGWALAFRASLPIEGHNSQISLMTGMVAARMMLDTGVGVLRTMPVAEPDQIERLRRRARGLGVSWPQDMSYPDVLVALDRSLPAGAAFLTAAVSLFRGAQWEPFMGAPPHNVVHGAIGAPYAHVTAPLRRLVDRYGTEMCLAAFAGTQPPEWVLAGMDALGAVMATGAHRTSVVDRSCTDLVEAAVLASHVGEVFDAVALDTRTVQLSEPAVVARTQDDDLPAGRQVRVRLIEADTARRSVRLERVREA